MAMVKYGSEAWVLRKTEEDSIDVFQRNSLRFVLGTRLTDRISNSRLYEKWSSNTLFRAIMRKKLRMQGHVLRMKRDRLPKIVLSTSRLGLNRKQSVRGLDEDGEEACAAV